MFKVDFKDSEENDELYVGTAHEIKALYESLEHGDEFLLLSPSLEKAVFNPDKMYGVFVDHEECFANLICEHTALYMLNRKYTVGVN